MPHKAKGGDADADGRREDGSEGGEAGVEGAAGREYIVDYEYVPDVGCIGGSWRCGECSCHVADLVFNLHLGLGPGASATFQQVGPEGYAHGFCCGGCNDLGLVVSSFQPSGPVQGDRHNHVHIDELFRCSKASAQHPSEEASGIRISVVFDLIGNEPVFGLAVVEYEGCGIGVSLMLGRSSILYHFIESVCHWIMAHRPEERQRQIRQTVQAQMPFIQQKPLSADKAYPGKHDLSSRTQSPQNTSFHVSKVNKKVLKIHICRTPSLGFIG